MAVAGEMSGKSRGAAHPRPEYARALRHSRRVRLLKILFPSLAGLIVIGFIGVSMLKASLPGIVFDQTMIENGKLVMKNPVVSGQTSAGQFYSITAARAMQDLTNTDLIELRDVIADIPVTADDTAKVVAPGVAYDRATEKLSFDQPFEVTTSFGATAQLQSANVDVEAGTLATNQRVHITASGADLVANSMQMGDNGSQIAFVGRIRMTVEPSALQKPPTGNTGKDQGPQ